MVKIVSVFFSLGLSVLAGCAPGNVTVTSYDKQVEIRLPTFEIDRYEPVIFPAARLQ